MNQDGYAGAVGLVVLREAGRAKRGGEFFVTILPPIVCFELPLAIGSIIVYSQLTSKNG